jgi:ribosomal protein L22
LTEEFLRKKPSAESGAGGLLRGGLASSSIFEDDIQAGSETLPKKKKAIARNPDTMAAAVDPDPRGRRRWERKIVIREIRKRGRLTRAQALKREERVILSKSHDFETSVKKLVPLAKQIAGKTVAKDVREHLEHAKNEAIVRRGMGLGLDGKEFTPIQIKTKDGKRVKVRDPTTLYVDQAWCGKGLFGRTPDYRARGNVHMMKNRTTSRFFLAIQDRRA